MKDRAWLVMRDGTIFEGISIGCKGHTVGEIVFNTAHVGYQEALTDKSYTSQILVFTSPHIGNVGCNQHDAESPLFCAAGIVLRESPTVASNWRSECDFQTYLEKHQIVGIAEIDTRQLTRYLRDKGNMTGCITSGTVDIPTAKNLAAHFQQHQSPALINTISTKTSYPWNQDEKNHRRNLTHPHIVIYDFGVKQNISRLLTTLGYKVTIVPASTSALTLSQMYPDGIILSNGPGDPNLFHQQIAIIQDLLTLPIPLLGICLGHQLLGLACGGTITKLKFGHHGINHPIKELKTGSVYINSQNHNFVISDNHLPKDFIVTHRSLFDSSIQGIEHKNKPIWGRQGHPEGCPGPVLPDLIKPFLASVVSFSEKKTIGSTTCQKILS